MLRRQCIFSAIIACLLWAGSVRADVFDYGDFAQIPVQHEGRIKPLGTLALAHVERFYGKAHIGDMPAVAWLAQTMFDPSKAIESPVFLVKDMDARAMLELPEKPDHLYSFAEITPAIASHQALISSLLQLPSQQLSEGQRVVVQLYDDSAAFSQLALSCTLFLPLSGDAAGASFMDQAKNLPLMQKQLQDIVRRKGTHLEHYSADEKRLAEIAQRLTMTLRSTENNTLLRILPPQWSAGDEWLSPWAVFHAGQGSPKTAQTIGLWRDLALAYQQKNAAQWKKSSAEILKNSADTQEVRPFALSLETLYYRWHLLGKSMLLYMAAFVLSLWCVSGARASSFRSMAFGAAAAAAILHGVSIAARVYILQRPPVGTLYESLLFVSWVAVVFGLFLERRMQNHVGLLVATLSGSGLLFVSQSFGSEDTMSMLIAVLNTNFWLATHVLCITIGYGFGMASGIIAHIYLIMRCAGSPHEKTQQTLRGGFGTALIALLFTSLGTILGGIWADQSWGRFWGWDPKENGALVICLWLIWLLHGRISARLGERGFVVGMALLNVVISLSWLGVNLLSTGLHSYGFTDKAALSLGLFCFAEIAFAAVTYGIMWRRDNARA